MIFFAIIGLPALITLFFEGNKTDEIVKNDEKTNVGTSIRLIKVLDEESQEIMEIEFEEYIKGVVAGNAGFF